MSYEWGGPTPPAGTFDGQLHIDSHGTIREFSTSLSAWLNRPNYFQVQAVAQQLTVNGTAVGSDFWDGNLNSTATNQWDDFFDRTFVKVTWRTTGQVQYVAHVTHAELRAWVAANAPQAAGVYTSDGVVEAYEVVSPDMRISRFMSMHRLYGSMRGRKSYQGAYGRAQGDPQNGLFHRAGWGTRFEAWWNNSINIPTALIQGCYGQTPATDESRVVWFPNANHVNKNRAFHEIYLPSADLNGRMVWDTATQTYLPAPAGTYQQDATASRGNIRWAACQEPGNTILILDKITDLRDMQGCGWMWPRSGRGPLSLVALIPVSRAGTQKAFLAFPVGVTHVTLKVPQTIGSASEFVAVNQYDESLLSDYRVKVTAPELENPTSDMWRFAIQHASRLIGAPGTPWRRNLDYQGIPSRLQFYVRNPVTGLRSALADRQIVKQVRTKNMGLGFFESPM